ncbi:origin recognition complex subunit 1, putative [Bodo saltans]|uniref:Origin recognition complex subunit 1 n=1 Tax=Bodo saltans TaxID=75058 RepID=A0A0S4IYS1_BODSA|nr:origin recognition complex subunit 1, putative [Bodo saltans]|eukprot:CUG59094.1 origin recognition complex subunit 1, putative [Bodo saltans]
MPAKRTREEARPPPPPQRKAPTAVAASSKSTSGRGAPQQPTTLRVDEAKAILRRGIERLCIGGNVLRPTDELLGRETQVQQILHFFSTDAHKTLMLFGMPGTGKTCAVKHAIARAGDSVTSIFINGYIVQRPTDVYRSICEHLTRTRLGHEEVLPAEQSASYLERRFRTQGWNASGGTGGGRASGRQNIRTCIIVVDELDKCIEKNPKVLYRLVEWLSLPHAHCRLIGIANSMEFPMDQKTKSRLDSTNQVVFHPYAEKELMAILDQRLGTPTLPAATHVSKIPVMSRRAMEYVCKQTASQYGDVRRLLQSTSSAVHGLYCAFEEGEAQAPDLETASKGLVDFRHVHAVISRVYQERFRDFVMNMKGEILFMMICVVSVETRQIEKLREGGGGDDGNGGGGGHGNSSSPSIGLDYLFQQCLSVLEAYHDRLGYPDARVLTRTLYLKHLTTLQQVGFLEFSLGGGSSSDSATSRVPAATHVSKIPVMSRRAMEYVCKQTASQYGDVRRLLQSTSSAVHGLYCAFEEGEAQAPDLETASKGLVDFRHVHAVISRVYQERFRDFVMNMKGEILFMMICVVSVETRQIEKLREGGGGDDGNGGGGGHGNSSSPSIGLDYLFQQCLSVLEAYHDRLGYPDARVLTRTLYLKHLTTLQQVGFLEFSLGGGSSSDSATSRVPVKDVWACRTANEPMWVTMSQLPEVVLTMCEVHDTLGTAMKSYLTHGSSSS